MIEAGRLVVGSITQRRVDFFETATGLHTGAILDLVAEPHELTADVPRRRAYLTHTYRQGVYGEGHEKGHEVSVIDVDRQSLEEVIDIAPYAGPHGIQYCPVRDRIYVGVENVGHGCTGVVVIDPETRTVTGSIPTWGPNSHWIALAPSGDRAWICHKDAGGMSILDLETETYAGMIEIPGGTEEVACSANGRWVFAVHPALQRQTADNCRILRIDAETGEINAELAVGRHVIALSTAPHGEVLVAHRPADGTTGDNGVLLVIDGESMTLRSAIQLSQRRTFTSRPSLDGYSAFVANLGSGTVSVIDLRDDSVVTTMEQCPGLDVGGTHGLCVLPPGPCGPE